MNVLLRRSISASLFLTLCNVATAGETRFVRGSAPVGGNGQSWATAYRNLFNALDDAAAHPVINQIWVAAGTYTPNRGNSDRDQVFTLVNAVSIYGGFAGNETSLNQRNPATNPTLLSGDFENNDLPAFDLRDDNARCIARGTDLAGGLLDGFTLRGGNSDVPGDALLGGAALHLHRCTYSVANCRFTDNAAGGTDPDIGGFGGAVFIQGGQVEMSRCVFQANRGMNGGALGIAGFELNRSTMNTVVRMADCDFLANFSPSQLGGAIWSVTGDPLNPSLGIIGDIHASRCRFIDSDAEYYGAWIDQNTPDFFVEDCEFSGNSSRVAGGALAMIQTVGIPSTARILGCTFEGNNGAGSAVRFEARPGLLANCIMRGNIGPATLSSGPLIGFQCCSEPLEIHNCLIHDNTGTGVFGFRNPSLIVRNSTITRNPSTIGGGGLAGGIETSAGVVVVADAILWGNDRAGVMDESAQIRSFAVAPSVNFCVVQGLTGGLGGTGNLGLDPLFEDAATGHFHLSSGSPAIDAGSNPESAPDSFDLDADADTAERIPFDLAGVSRFLSDPLTPDTGVSGAGHSQVVDIGAFEFAVCVGDLDGDGAVRLADLAQLLSHFGTASGAQPSDGDIDGDHDVDLTDLTLLLSRFGLPCP